jgi:hypothetical protein
MKALQRNFYFFITVLALSSCASFENLTDDRTRAEDDEMYWNGKELFYDNSLVVDAAGTGDDYYDHNYTTRANSLNGGTNPRAMFNPISGWQLSYGLNSFSNYNNPYGMGFNSLSPYNSHVGFGGYGNYGYNPYGYNSYGYNPYSSFNPYGGYGYNPYGYGLGGLGWGGYGYGNGWYGNGNGWNGNGGVCGSSNGGGETPNVTHHHRRPTSVGTGNSSTYGRGVLQKSLVQPISEASRTPQSVATARSNNYNYSNPTYSRPSSTNTQAIPSYSSPSRSTPSHTRPSNSGPSRTTPPTYTSPSRPSPSYSSPSPSRSAPTKPSASSPSPSRSTPTRTSPAPSSPTRTTSPGKRP